MAWPDSAGTCQSHQTGSAGSILQLGRRPDLSGLGSAALDVATCCKIRLSRPGFANVQFLRELKEVLQSAQARVRDHTTSETQHRYLLDAGGADDYIDCPAEIEPTLVVSPSAKQLTLDKSVVRCSKKDRALAGTDTAAASRKRGRDRTRKGGAE